MLRLGKWCLLALAILGLAACGSSSSKGSASARKDIQIVAKGFTQFPPDSIGSSYLTYAIVLHNPNAADASKPWVATRISLNVSFTDAAGNVVASDNPTVDYVSPGQYVAATDGSVQAKGATSMNVQMSIGSWQQNDGQIVGSFTTSGVTTTSETYSAKTVGTLSSTFKKEYKNVHVDAVYEGKDGQILGGDGTYVDFIPAGGSVSFGITTFNLPPGIQKTMAYAGLTVLSTLASK
jgi:hypothetical protein